MRDLLFDVRIAWRGLRHHPALLAVAVLTLGSGIGVAATVFAAVDHLLLSHVPGVTEPERVVEIGRSFQGQGFDTLSYPELVDLSERVPELASVAAWRTEPLSLATGDGGERIQGMIVSPSYFEVLGVAPVHGRFFLDEEGDPGDRRAVTVVSHRFFTERLAADPTAVGRTVEIDRQPFTVVGVAPEVFRGHVVAMEPDVWVPLGATALVRPEIAPAVPSRGTSWLHLMGRLAPGASVDQADAAVAALFDALRAEEPEVYRQRSARLLPLRFVPGGGREATRIFFSLVGGLVALLVIVVCSNLAGLLLARGLGRRREMAVRLAVGASRGRVVRQLLVETLLLFVAGGAAGALIAAWGTELLRSFRVPFLPSATPVLDVHPDLRLLAFAFGVSLVAALIFGLVPALQASRPELVAGLKDDAWSPGTRGGRLRRGFVALQVAVSLLLMVAAALFLRSLGAAAEIDTGFEAREVRTLTFDLSQDGYSDDEGARFVDRLLDRLEGAPRVAAAALSLDLPLDFAQHGNGFFLEGDEPGDPPRGTDFNVVSAGYFETLGIPLLAGRGFTRGDRAGAPLVVVVSRRFAETVWPDGDALGRQLRFFAVGTEPRTVVGVVGEVKNQTLSEETEPMLYLPLSQQYEPELYLTARPAEAADPDFAPMLHREMLELDPALALGPVQPLSTITSVSLLPQRLAAGLTTGLGLLGLLLSGIGVYGVVAYAASARRHEVGIRMALGADRLRVLGTMVRREMLLAAPGLLAGLLLALAAGRLLDSLLLGVSPLDPLALGVSVVAMALVVLLASFLPARRASEVDPAEALRGQ